MPRVSRHLSRALVMQTLFAYEFQGGKPNELLDFVAEEYSPGPSDLQFAKVLLDEVLQFRDETRILITKYAPQWPVEKLAPVDRAILEIALCEMLHSKDVPPVVAIDEAIELAKTFGNENSPKFINGVLNAIHKRSSTS